MLYLNEEPCTIDESNRAINIFNNNDNNNNNNNFQYSFTVLAQYNNNAACLLLWFIEYKINHLSRFWYILQYIVRLK